MESGFQTSTCFVHSVRKYAIWRIGDVTVSHNPHVISGGCGPG